METTAIALLGNPNAGKTTLFNRLTGTRQSTGNWPGVTVDRKDGSFNHNNIHYHVVDLPGTYSLDRQQSSVDELIARQFIQEQRDFVYINVIDANTLERGLYLTTQLREQGVATVVFLTMMDIVEKRGIKINIDRLSEALDCPVISGHWPDQKNPDTVVNFFFEAIENQKKRQNKKNI